MARFKNKNWDLTDPPSCIEHVNIAVLMDIRDEMQRLNTLLHCTNFQMIPSKLDRIVRNTTKRRRRRAK